MPSPNDGLSTDLPRDDGPAGGRYLAGGWDPVSGVWRALKSFGDRSLLVLFSKGATVNQSQATVTTTSTFLVNTNAARKVATIYNLGPATIFLKPGTGASATTDYPLPPGAEFEDKHSTTLWHGITASGTADVRVRETF